MRALRTCDFCGADSATAFELLPPDLEPTEAEQRRVVLCPDCKRLLSGLLEPLIARARAEPDGRAVPTAGENANASGGNARASSAAAREHDAADAESGGTGAPIVVDSPTDESADTEDGENAAGPRPPAYGQALRLLRNRDLPMARSAVEELVAGAYELDDTEVDAVLEHAIERGDLVEAGGAIRLPAE